MNAAMTKALRNWRYEAVTDEALTAAREALAAGDEAPAIKLAGILAETAPESIAVRVLKETAYLHELDLRMDAARRVIRDRALGKRRAYWIADEGLTAADLIRLANDVVMEAALQPHLQHEDAVRGETSTPVTYEEGTEENPGTAFLLPSFEERGYKGVLLIDLLSRFENARDAYVVNCTLHGELHKNIAADLGVSEPRVSQLRKRAYKQLRAQLTELVEAA